MYLCWYLYGYGYADAVQLFAVGEVYFLDCFVSLKEKEKQRRKKRNVQRINAIKAKRVVVFLSLIPKKGEEKKFTLT